MKKILNKLLDLPQMINSKLPGNTFNSWVQESEGNIPNWVGKFYRVSALVVLLASLMVILSPIWSGEKLDILANILSMLIWVYAAFPISQVIRSAGDSLASSKSGIIDFIFKDLAIANIKVLGHVAAIVALFGAFAMTLSWATSMNVSGDFATEWIANIDYAYALPMAATAELANLLNLEFIGDILAKDWTNWDPTMASGSAWSWDGLMSVAWEYVGVAAVLAKLYVVLAIYKFFYSIISSFVNWIKSPYLPFKTK
jgi:ABC-type multidrug transport system fused ATPase/permease subunit